MSDDREENKQLEDLANESTPADIHARGSSVDRIGFGTIESSLASVAANLRPLARSWDKASDVERRALAARLAPELRELGDFAHDFARWLEELAAGV
jgi:hypothetical protein